MCPDPKPFNRVSHSHTHGTVLVGNTHSPDIVSRLKFLKAE